MIRELRNDKYQKLAWWNAPGSKFYALFRSLIDDVTTPPAAFSALESAYLNTLYVRGSGQVLAYTLGLIDGSTRPKRKQVFGTDGATVMSVEEFADFAEANPEAEVRVNNVNDPFLNQLNSWITKNDRVRQTARVVDAGARVLGYREPIKDTVEKLKTRLAEAAPKQESEKKKKKKNKKKKGSVIESRIENLTQYGTHVGKAMVRSEGKREDSLKKIDATLLLLDDIDTAISAARRVGNLFGALNPLNRRSVKGLRAPPHLASLEAQIELLSKEDVREERFTHAIDNLKHPSPMIFITYKFLPLPIKISESLTSHKKWFNVSDRHSIWPC